MRYFNSANELNNLYMRFHIGYSGIMQLHFLKIALPWPTQ